jgi:hypothetical protein
VREELRVVPRVVANEPVPEPVTSEVRVMVWSPVLVPETEALTEKVLELLSEVARVATCEPEPGPAVTSPVSWEMPEPPDATPQVPSALSHWMRVGPLKNVTTSAVATVFSVPRRAPVWRATSRGCPETCAGSESVPLTAEGNGGALV